MNDTLVGALQVVVPMWIDQVADWTDGQRLERAQVCARAIGSQGDVIQFKSPKKGGTAEAFNRMAEGLALGAYGLGGIGFGGVHWCAAVHPLGVISPSPCAASTALEQTAAGAGDAR
jgi:hypothetical protein